MLVSIPGNGCPFLQDDGQGEVEVVPFGSLFYTGRLPVGVSKIRFDAYSEDGKGSLKLQITGAGGNISESAAQAIGSNWKIYYFDKPTESGNIASLLLLNRLFVKVKTKFMLITCVLPIAGATV